MESESLLIWGMLFGAVGLGYFIYGKKQKAPVPLIVGIAIFVFAYSLSAVSMLICFGLAIMAAPYFIKL